MENYLCIGGKKTELTPKQLEELGVPYKRRISDMTPDEIAKIVHKGDAHKHFELHDTVTVGEDVYEIVDMAPDFNANGELEPSVTFMLVHPDVARHRMNNGACAKGWIDCEYRKWLVTDFLKRIPKEWQNVMQLTRKYTHDSEGVSHISVDKLWLPSESELFGSAIYSRYMDGRRYEAFETSADRVRRDLDDDTVWYWTRSAASGNTTVFVTIYYSGYVGSSSASNAPGGPVCFRIS